MKDLQISRIECEICQQCEIRDIARARAIDEYPYEMGSPIGQEQRSRRHDGVMVCMVYYHLLSPNNLTGSELL